MSRNAHERYGEEHYGDLPASLVELSEMIGSFPTGTSIQEVLASLHLQVLALERGTLHGGLFSAHAVVFKQQDASAVVNAIVKATKSGDFKLDAAMVELLAIVYGSAVVDAILQKTMSGNKTADAILMKNQSTSTTIDASTLSVADSNNAYVSQIAIEVLGSEPNPQTYVSQIAVEVLRQNV